jgi:hypothetical protein
VGTGNALVGVKGLDFGAFLRFLCDEAPSSDMAHTPPPPTQRGNEIHHPTISHYHSPAEWYQENGNE